MSVTLHKGDRAPSVWETIRVGDTPYDLTGLTGKFKMRPELLATPLKVDAAAEVVTESTTLSGAHELPSSTLTVASTADFLDDGALLVGGQIVEYVAKTATKFLGCTGGTGTVSNGASVAQIGGIRYAWAAADVDTAGKFRGFWEITLSPGVVQTTPEFPVTILEHGPVGRPLCSLADVLSYVPAYQSDQETDEKLEALIEAESQTIHQDLGREFVAIAGADPRLFEITGWNCRTRRIRIGDCAAVTTVRVLDEDGTVRETVAAADRDELPLTRQEWEPIRQIKLLSVSPNPATIMPGQRLEVTGSWGFPSVPANVREACAKLVIVRYLSDVANDGTRFAEALNNSEISIAGLLRSAGDALRDYGGAPFA